MTSADPEVRARQLQRPSAKLLTQLPLLIALVAFWVVLWGHLDVISVVTGVVFSTVVVRMFELPPVLLSGRVHPWYLFVLIAKVLWWLTSATAQIAWWALRPQPVPIASIIANRLRTHSDWLLTLCADINMLVPGSAVVETDRSRSILYLHILGGTSDEAVAAARIAAEEIEDAVVLALGNHEDLALINDDRAARGRPPLWNSRAQRAYEQRRRERREAQAHAWEVAS